MASSLSQFNSSLHEFVNDLSRMSIMSKDVEKLKNYIEIIHLNARAIIGSFQTYMLRDVIVYNILNENTDFFLNYDIVKNYSITDDKISSLIEKVREIVRCLLLKGEVENVKKTFNWLKVLCYHAYSDLGMNASDKFISLGNLKSVDN